MTWTLKANLIGPRGAEGPAGIPGPNAVPADEAVAGFIASTASDTHDALEPYRPEGGGRPVGKRELVVNAADYIGFSSRPIQAAIDSLSGPGKVLVPAGEWALDTVRMDGSNGGKSGVALVGAGIGVTVLRQSANARAIIPTYTDNTQSPNVVEARSGGNFTLKAMSIIANAKTGGLKPARAVNWIPGTLYTYSPTTAIYRSTTSTGEATTNTDKSPDVKVWKLNATHTANAGTNITADAQYWDEVTNYAALNYYWYGESFNRNHGVSFTADKGTPLIDGVKIIEVEVKDAAYASILLGTGAVVHDDYVTAGVRNSEVISCKVSGSAAGIGGGHKTNCTISSCEISATSNLVNVDEGSFNVTITGNTIFGDPVQGGGNGISSYMSSFVTVTGNTIMDVQQGINFQDSDGTSSRANAITGNTVIRCQTGIALGSESHAAVAGNQLSDCTGNGIKVTDSFNVVLSGNTVNDSALYGIQIEGGHSLSVTGNGVFGCGRDGFYVHGLKNSTFSANVAGNNNKTGTVDGSGLRFVEGTAGICANIIVVGNRCADLASPQTQRWGIYIGANCASFTVGENDTQNNMTAGVNNLGTNNMVAWNRSASTAELKHNASMVPATDNALSLGGNGARYSTVRAVTFTGYDGNRVLRWGVGSPEGAIAAAVGSVYFNTTGPAGQIMWVKESGTGGNGWVAK